MSQPDNSAERTHTETEKDKHGHTHHPDRARKGGAEEKADNRNIENHTARRDFNYDDPKRDRPETR